MSQTNPSQFGAKHHVTAAKLLIEEPEVVQVLTGLETWFELPKRPQKALFKRYKIVLLPWLIVFFTLTIVWRILNSVLVPLPEFLA